MFLILTKLYSYVVVQVFTLKLNEQQRKSSNQQMLSVFMGYKRNNKMHDVPTYHLSM